MNHYAIKASILLLAAISLHPYAEGSKVQGIKSGHHREKLSGEVLQYLLSRGPVDSRLLGKPGGDWIEVDIRLRRLKGSALASLRQAGLEPIGIYPRHSRIAGRATRQSLAAIAALDEVLTIHRNQPALSVGGLRANRRPLGLEPCGTMTGHSDLIEELRQEFKVDGSDIKIGIISDSFRSDLPFSNAGSISGEGCHRALTGSEPQLRGELPEEVFVVDDGAHDGGDEGRAMAEIIFDLAPGAKLFFHGGGSSMPAMAEAIDRLAECNLDIIVDDLFFSRQPMFQDGIIAQAAERAVQPPPDLPRRKKIAYFTIAGNQGPFGIDQTYQDSSPLVDEADLDDGVDLHEFAPGRRFLPIVMPTGCGVGLVLQWAEPFSSEDDMQGGGASTDLDLYLCEEKDPDTCRIGSFGGQGCSIQPIDQPSGDPMELISSSINTSSRDVTMYLAVDHFCGRKDIRFRIVTFAKRGCEVNLGISSDSDNQRVRFGEDSTEQSIFTQIQMYGHPVARGVAAVAAVPFAEIDNNSTIAPPNELNVERFSARGGPIPILFDPWGKRLEKPEVRQQPKFTAPDRIETSFFGNPATIFGDRKANRCFEFGGTSASAPYAAGIAALLLDLDERLEPSQIIQILSDTAQAIAEPDRSGKGLIQVRDALQRVRDLPPPPGWLRASFDPAQLQGTLRWGAVQGIKSYAIEIQILPTEESVLEGIVQATIYETPPLSKAEGYRWRVQSIDEKGSGPWSEWVKLNKARRKLPPGFRNLPASTLQRTGEEMP